MAATWGLIWNATIGLSHLTGLCEGGAHLTRPRLAPQDTSVAACGNPGSYVAPAYCNDSSTKTGARTKPGAEPHSKPSEVHRYLFSYVSRHADPLLHVTIRGNCLAVPLDPTLSPIEATRLCLARSPHAVCSAGHEPKLYAGMHLGESRERPLLLQLNSAPSRLQQRKRTLSLLDTGLCEHCRAPASVHAADAVRLLDSRAVGAAGLGSSKGYNLTVEVTFSPVVRGPHLLYVREEFASLEVALRAGPAHGGAAERHADDNAGMGRGPYLGTLVPGSPFKHIVHRQPRAAAQRACGPGDFAELSRAAFVAPDAGTLALPKAQWQLRPRGCTVARHALNCDGMVACLRTRQFSLMGDSMMERLRYAFSITLLPPSEWYLSSCLSFNPRYLMIKRSYNGSAQLGLSECDETFRLRPDSKCGGRSRASASQILGEFRRRHALGRGSPDGGAECGATLVLNLGGLHTAAKGGTLTMEGYGGAVRDAIRLALDVGFGHVVYLSTAAAHPIAYPPLEAMPPLFYGMNGPRTRRTAEIAATVAAEFPRRRVSVVDAHSVTALLGEEAGLGCHDIRHQDHAVYRQVASLLLGSVCPADVA